MLDSADLILTARCLNVVLTYTVHSIQMYIYISFSLRITRYSVYTCTHVIKFYNVCAFPHMDMQPTERKYLMLR